MIESHVRHVQCRSENRSTANGGTWLMSVVNVAGKLHPATF